MNCIHVKQQTNASFPDYLKHRNSYTPIANIHRKKMPSDTRRFKLNFKGHDFKDQMMPWVKEEK